ncbi:MAG: hypothetical protein HQM10_24545 [Candidatus Riflebacteria bacterium]|nr:hypothetical protein [Candidatus Riflebacteria bacterium]
MRKILFVLFVLLSLLSSTSIFASNYPSDYTRQRAFVSVDGPVVLSLVESGIGSWFVIGYKKNGILGVGSSINAYVKVTREKGVGYNYPTSEEFTFRIEREWQDTGFLSTPISGFSFIGPVGLKKVEIAFFSGDRWDSKYGTNYVFDDFNTFRSRPETQKFTSSNNYAYPTLAGDVWEFLVKIMKQ